MFAKVVKPQNKLDKRNKAAMFVGRKVYMSSDTQFTSKMYAVFQKEYTYFKHAYLLNYKTNNYETWDKYWWISQVVIRNVLYILHQPHEQYRIENQISTILGLANPL